MHGIECCIVGLYGIECYMLDCTEVALLGCTVSNVVMLDYIECCIVGMHCIKCCMLEVN